MNIEDDEDAPPGEAWYTREQLNSPDPHVVVEATVRAGPGLGENTSPRAIAVMLSVVAFERLRRPDAQH